MPLIWLFVTVNPDGDTLLFVVLLGNCCRGPCTAKGRSTVNLLESSSSDVKSAKEALSPMSQFHARGSKIYVTKNIINATLTLQNLWVTPRNRAVAYVGSGEGLVFCRGGNKIAQPASDLRNYSSICRGGFIECIGFYAGSHSNVIPFANTHEILLRFYILPILFLLRFT